MFFNLKIALAGVAALLIGLYLQLFGFNPMIINHQKSPAIEGYFWPEQKAITEFSMGDHNGATFTENRFKGKWNFVFFGYTHCPDICPITMNTMRQTRDLLVSHPEYQSLNFVFTSVDGERDTASHLNGYINFFGDKFTGLTGSKDQIDSLTNQLGIPYTIDDHEPGEDYLVGHSGAIFLVSPNNSLAAILQPPHEAGKIAEKFSKILMFLQSQ